MFTPMVRKPLKLLGYFKVIYRPGTYYKTMFTMEKFIYCLLQFCKLIELMVSANFRRIVLETNHNMPIVYHVQTP